MRLTGRIEGDLRQALAEDMKMLEGAVTTSVRRAGTFLRNDLRRQTDAALRIRRGGSGKLSSSWKRIDFPKGRQKSMSAASMVYADAAGRRIFNAHRDGVTIGPRSARWLVVPLEAAERRGLALSQRRSKGSRPRRWGALEAAIANGEQLATKPIGRNRALVVDRRTGEALFLLLKTVRLPRRLNFDGLGEKWQARIPGYIVAEMDRAERRGGDTAVAN